MIPCILIKISTSAAMAVLTACTGDLVQSDQRRILMFSVAVWARAWFLWAPFIGMTSYFGVLVPLTVFALISVLGGGLLLVIDRHECRAGIEADQKAAYEKTVAEAVEREILMLGRSSFCLDMQITNLRKGEARTGDYR